MKHKARKKAVASERSPNTNKTDLITQHINAHGHKEVAQICLWIKDLYEVKETELRCVG